MRFQKRGRLMSCWDRSLNILSRRDHSIKELKDKLFKKEYSPQDVEETLQKLIDKKYLDDERCFDSRCRMLIARRLGKRRIQNDITLHGLLWNPERFETLLSEFDPEYNRKTMEALLVKKSRSSSFQKKLTEAVKDRRAAYKLQSTCAAHLIMKGFSMMESSEYARLFVNEKLK